MSEAPTTLWVTRSALTAGIHERKLITISAEHYAYVEAPGAPPYGLQCGPKDWHPTREAALSRAEEMRAAKIASLKRQIAKLEALTF